MRISLRKESDCIHSWNHAYKFTSNRVNAPDSIAHIDTHITYTTINQPANTHNTGFHFLLQPAAVAVAKHRRPAPLEYIHTTQKER